MQARPGPPPDTFARDSKCEDAGERTFREQRIAHWNGLSRRGPRNPLSDAFHARLARVYELVVPPGASVLEIGCGDGDLLAALHPGYGVGVDFSEEAIRRARARHPSLHFVQSDAGRLGVGGTFDVVILSDLVNDLWDVQDVLDRVREVSHPRTRLVLNAYSRLWELPVRAAGRLGLSRPLLPQNWLTVEDIDNLLRLSGFEMIRHWEEVCWPLPTPGVMRFANQVLARFPPFSYLAAANFIVARPSSAGPRGNRQPSVSVIVPARNEAGNIDAIFRRTPEMGGGTELIFVEGHSRDDTNDAIQRAMRRWPNRHASLFRQAGTGKGDAVRLGFSHASGDILMILDGDLTVPPEDLPRFFDALASGRAEFVNGVRLVYPMEKQAMRFWNLLANKLFGLSFSWLLGQPVKDTLCGTKALWRSDYELIARNRPYFGEFDPFGDFDLLFGAAKLNLHIVDLPIRYRDRTYGTTNIQRWRHGLLLVRMLAFAARRLKFV